MKITSREAGLGLLTGLLILFTLTYILGAPKFKTWREREENQKTLTQRIEIAKRLIGNQDVWHKRLAELRARLSSYPPDMDVTADYLKILERVARQHGVNLVQRRPQKEKKVGNCFQMPIECTWEADLPALVHFLYALEQENVTMDMEELIVSLVAGGKARLKGNFTLMCIYTRESNTTSTPTSNQFQTAETITNQPTTQKPVPDSPKAEQD